MNEPTTPERGDAADDRAPRRGASTRHGTPIRYFITCENYLEVNANLDTYTRYLDAHPEWFTRCAAPMEVQALDAQSYAITIGRFGAFDWTVEPKIGLRLMSQQDGVYWTHSVPVPGHEHPSYDVDFRSSMALKEVPPSHAKDTTTSVKWTLKLAVAVWFPGFVRILPEKLLQSTGDRMLGRIVRMVSERFTEKVQRDFHQAMSLSIPEQSGSRPWDEAS